MQRPLWASTSTKNPAYPDLAYVDTLIGPDTVNTMPDETIAAFLDHGTVARTVDADPDAATAALDRIEAAGVDMADVARTLEDEGVASFAKSFDELMQKLVRQGQRPVVRCLKRGAWSTTPAPSCPGCSTADPGLWPAGNVSANRLGWLDVPRRMAAEAADLKAWAAGIEQSTVVLLGMGGSSLGPAVLEAVLSATGTPAGPGPARRRLVVCDTTHPVTVSSLDLSDAFVLVSSKSGTTLEPNALLAHAWAQLPDPPATRPSPTRARPWPHWRPSAGFRRCFANPPDIGGRYSVLSYFGMVPAALIGYDVAELCARALSTDLEEAAGLGMAMGEDARAGRDKVTIVVPPEYASFGLWVEQLIAESTGKQGTGCVPVPTTEPEDGPDRHVVPLHPDGPGRPRRAVLPLGGRHRAVRARARDRPLRRAQRGRVEEEHQRRARQAPAARGADRRPLRGPGVAHRHGATR